MTGYDDAQVFGAIREIFQVFDTNGDKALDDAELRHAFACMVMGAILAPSLRCYGRLWLDFATLAPC